MQERRSPLHLALSLVAAAALASLVACAAGAEGTGDDDPVDAARIDAPNNPNADASTADARPADARLVDGPVSQPDAAIPLPDGGIPGTCTTNADCPVPGECCFLIACTAGTPLPPPINCLPS